MNNNDIIIPFPQHSKVLQPSWVTFRPGGPECEHKSKGPAFGAGSTPGPFLHAAKEAENMKKWPLCDRNMILLRQ